MIDTNLSIGHWPFRDVPGDDLANVTKRLRQAGIKHAWTGHLDGLFQRDVAGVNLRLAELCRQVEPGLLMPFGTINPTLPDWEDDLRRCHEVHQFRGIRLHPGFHGYDLNDSVVAQLFRQASDRNMLVQLVVAMEDERTQNSVFRVPAFELSPLLGLVRSISSLRLVVLNAFRKLSLNDAGELAATDRVWFDIAMLEGVDRASALSEKVNPTRILFGSHFPLFYIESSVLKLRETKLPETIVELIRNDNARILLNS